MCMSVLTAHMYVDKCITVSLVPTEAKRECQVPGTRVISCELPCAGAKCGSSVAWVPLTADPSL